MLADGHLNSAWLAARLPARARTLTDLRLTMMVRPLRPVLGLAAMAGDKEISVSQLQAGAESLEPPLGELMNRHSYPKNGAQLYSPGVRAAPADCGLPG